MSHHRGEEMSQVWSVPGRSRTSRLSPGTRHNQDASLRRGIVHCATGHNPLRMHGKERKGITYYACSYRISYGDKAAEALGHGKWHYVREDLPTSTSGSNSRSRNRSRRRSAGHRPTHRIAKG